MSPIDTFCVNIEWIRNRGVTLGCAQALYCPTADVPRNQMAAFMNRLGTAMTPSYLTVQSDQGSGDLGQGVRVCQTTDYAVLGFPRTAIVDGHATVYGSATDQAVYANLGVSVDSGSSWNGTASSLAIGRVNTAPGSTATVPVLSAPIPMSVGQAYRFSIVVITSGLILPSTAGAASVYCSLRVRIENDNGTSSPFDAAAAPVDLVQ